MGNRATTGSGAGSSAVGSVAAGSGAARGGAAGSSKGALKGGRQSAKGQAGPKGMDPEAKDKVETIQRVPQRLLSIGSGEYWF